MPGLFDDLPDAKPGQGTPMQAAQGGGLFDDLPTVAQRAYGPIAQVPGGVRMGRGGIVPTPEEMKERREAAEASMRGASQGASFGAGDEIVGGVVGAYNWLGGNGYLEHYERARDENRAANAAAEAAHPWAYNTGKIGGGLATMAVSGLPSLTALGTSVGGRILLGGAEGAAYGALQGFNEGEGGIADRAWNAGKGATIGTAGGIALPALAAGAGAGYRAILNSGPLPEALQEFSPGAVNRVARAFGDDAAAGYNYADEASRMLPEGMVLDLSGPNVRGQTEGIVSQPGPGSAQIVRALNERAAGAPDRIRAATDDALGSTAGRQAERQALLAERKANISPLYERAAEHATPLDAREVVNLIDDAILTASGKKKEALQNIRGQLFNGEVLKSSASALHEVRSEIGRGMRNEWSDVAGALKPIQRKLDEQLDTIPGYAEARARYADSKAIEEAQDAGSQVWSRNTRRDELEAALAGMSEAERRAYTLAARDAAAENMDNAGRTLRQIGEEADSIRGAVSTFGTRAGEDKLRMLAQTPEAGDAVVRRIQGEAAMANRANEIVGNSRTAARTAAQKEFPSAAEVGFNRNLAPATPTGLALAGLDWVARKASMGILDKIRGARTLDAAKIYTAAGETRDQIVKALMDRGVKVKAAEEQASEAVKNVTNALMNGRTGSLVANDGTAAVVEALSNGAADNDNATPLFLRVKPRRAVQ
jgi:hypothetical protein